MEYKKIIEELDKWVSGIPVSGFVPSDWEMPLNKYELSQSFAIQQCKDEILEFTSTVIHNKKLTNALEIGLGFYGSTHFLWRLIFEKISTIEKDPKRVREFSDRLGNYYGSWVMNDGKSNFIYGYSNEPTAVEAAYSLGKVDMLFIDGDHQYKAVLADYLLYEPLVNLGGIVAFHDTALKNYEYDVPKLMKQLQEGYFGRKINLKNIILSKSLGISYYIKCD